MRRLWPEMDALIGCAQEPEWHPEGDVWIHTLMVIDQARARIDALTHAEQVIIMLGAVCHDFGKPSTTAFIDGRIRSIGHEEGGVAPATAFLDRLNIHSVDGVDVRREVLGIVAHHLKPGMWHKVREEVGDGAFRRLAQKVEPRAAGGARESGLHGPHRIVRLLRNGLVPRACTCARGRASTARTPRAGPPSHAAGRRARARDGTVAAGDLRTPAGWRGHDDRGRGPLARRMLGGGGGTLNAQCTMQNAQCRCTMHDA